jgi:crotonobetainyl-CoA:carnitine CoA-transferase CaiB-like acyl-CoA transferase
MNLEVIREMSDQAIGTPASCCHCAPRLGEHTYEVMEELLGISGAPLATLKEDGIV